MTRDPATLPAMRPAAGARRDRLDRDAGRPLWAQLVDDLDQRLHSGEFPDEFPGEHELCREYDVSRHTVREALRRLRERGLLDSGRGRPTRVRQHVIEQPLGALYSLFREVEARGMVQRSDVVALEEVVDADVAGRLGLEPATPLLHLARLRWAGDEPLAVDRAWLPMAVAAPLLDVDFSRAGLYDQLELRCGVRPTGGRESITAGVPDDGDPCAAAAAGRRRHPEDRAHGRRRWKAAGVAGHLAARRQVRRLGGLVALLGIPDGSLRRRPTPHPVVRN